MWLNETTFYLILKDRERLRLSSSASRLEPLYTHKSVKHRESVMVWMCFSGENGRGSIFFLFKNQTMSRKNYVKCLEEKVLLQYLIHKLEICMQDRLPCHSAKGQVMTSVYRSQCVGMVWQYLWSKFNRKWWKVMKSCIPRASVILLPELKKEIVRVQLQKMSMRNLLKVYQVVCSASFN